MPRKGAPRKIKQKTTTSVAIPEEPSLDPSKLTCLELKNELLKRGLATTGSKHKLVERLESALPKTTTSVEPSLNPSKLKCADLKNELLKRCLDTSGSKPMLVERLEAALLTPAQPPPTKKPKDEEASPSAPVDYSEMKVADLKKELESRGLDTSGRKVELIDRLQGDIGGDALKEEPMEEEVMEETDFSKAKRALAADAAVKTKKKSVKHRKVDSYYYGGMKVFEDWDCMLNQTNIGHNNNKFYVIQLLKDEKKNIYKLWTRWGRVGESGQNAEGPNTDLGNAMKVFQKKFSDKTKNKWEDRANFRAVPGKYTLIEMDEEDEDESEEMERKLAALNEATGPAPISLPCSLDKSTQALIRLIFDADMFNNALKSMDLDTKKMPLGKLSKIQISKGIEALEEIEAAMDASESRSILAALTSKFYTIIPHNFGRNQPPIIVDKDMLQKKFDMLMVLGDIEIAQGLQQGKARIKSEVVTEVPHELDVQYVSLNASLGLLNHTSHEYKVISKYIKATAYPKTKLLDVWSVDRQGVNDRFKEHDAISNRRLLWHGTNIAVVAAILKSGLRIMPHSGGRVGRGIYLASENSKSIGYVCPARDGTGIMFLNEAVLGKEHHITVGDGSLTAPPTNYDCIIAKGRTEPDPKQDTELMLSGKKVIVPQGKPISTSFTASSFYQSEYLIYKESQTRIRYMIQVKT